MESKTLIGAIMAAVVGIILLGSLLGPTITAYNEPEREVTNTGSYFTVPDGEDHTIIVKADSITYDGEACIYPDLSIYGSATILIGDGWFCRLANESQGIQFVVAGPNQTYQNLGYLGGTITDVTIAISGTSATFDNGISTPSTRTDLEYTIAPSGDYVLSHDPYFIEDTVFIGAIRNMQQQHDIFEIVAGEFTDPENISAEGCRLYNFSTTSTTTLESSSVVVSADSLAGGNLYKLDVMTQSFVLGDDTEGTITIDYIIVPEKITYVNPDYIGDSTSAMIAAIMVLMIAALVIGAVAFLRPRD